MKKNLFFRS